MQYRRDIDGLRAIAVLAVIGFHAFPGIIRGGFVGVDVFFVISGFLISSIIFSDLETGSFSIAQFYAKRIRRIFPALISILIATYFAAWFILLPTEFKQLGKHIAGGAGFISNFVLLRESGYFDTISDQKPLLHLWSLGIEEQFYIIFPVAIYAAWRYRKHMRAVLLAGILLSLAYALFTIKKQPIAAFYSPIGRFWELLLGAFLGYSHFTKAKELTFPIWSKLKKGRAFDIFFPWFGIGLLIFSFFSIDKTVPYPGLWAFLPTIGTIILISTNSEALFSRKILGNFFLVFLGKISYPLYLWHWPLLALLRVRYADAPPVLAIVCAILASVLLSFLTFRFIEHPIRSQPVSLRRSLILSFVLLVVGAGGGITYIQNGFPSRVSSIIQGAENYDYLSQVHEMMVPYRSGTCFLKEDQDQAAFRDFCGELPKSGETSKEVIFLWGDSHAAHLYPGLLSAVGNGRRIYQYTASLCAPILGMEVKARPYCRGINDHIFQILKSIRPDQVVLAASWAYYPWKELHGTIRHLKALGIKRIFLVGPVPSWKKSLSVLMLEYYKSNKRGSMPERMNYGLLQDNVTLDAEMQREFSNEDINYLSIINILCESSGCLTKTNHREPALISWDDAHFTVPGSEYVVSKLRSWQ